MDSLKAASRICESFLHLDKDLAVEVVLRFDNPLLAKLIEVWFGGVVVGVWCGRRG